MCPRVVPWPPAGSPISFPFQISEDRTRVRAGNKIYNEEWSPLFDISLHGRVITDFRGPGRTVFIEFPEKCVVRSLTGQTLHTLSGPYVYHNGLFRVSSEKNGIRVFTPIRDLSRVEDTSLPHFTSIESQLYMLNDGNVVQWNDSMVRVRDGLTMDIKWTHPISRPLSNFEVGPNGYVLRDERKGETRIYSTATGKEHVVSSTAPFRMMHDCVILDREIRPLIGTLSGPRVLPLPPNFSDPNAICDTFSGPNHVLILVRTSNTTLTLVKITDNEPGDVVVDTVTVEEKPELARILRRSIALVYDDGIDFKMINGDKMPSMSTISFCNSRMSLVITPTSNTDYGVRCVADITDITKYIANINQLLPASDPQIAQQHAKRRHGGRIDSDDDDDDGDTKDESDDDFGFRRLRVRDETKASRGRTYLISVGSLSGKAYKGVMFLSHNSEARFKDPSYPIMRITRRIVVSPPSCAEFAEILGISAALKVHTLQTSGVNVEEFVKCDVCQVPLVSRDDVRIMLPCGHVFHSACNAITPSLKCPVCTRNGYPMPISDDAMKTVRRLSTHWEKMLQKFVQSLVLKSAQ